MIWAVIAKGLLDLAEVTVAAETILETCGYVRLWLLVDVLPSRDLRPLFPRKRTFADTYFRRDTALIERREKIKKSDNPKPPLESPPTSGLTSNRDEPDPPLRNRLNSPECFDGGQCYSGIKCASSSFLWRCGQLGALLMRRWSTSDFLQRQS